MKTAIGQIGVKVSVDGIEALKQAVAKVQLKATELEEAVRELEETKISITASSPTVEPT
jgi:hypothetical protein